MGPSRCSGSSVISRRRVVCCPSSYPGLPSYPTKFIEIVPIFTPDHGPAVSGWVLCLSRFYIPDSCVYSAMNTFVASRAGNDLISFVESGLLTSESRFGGMLDEAAAMFSNAHDKGLIPRELIDES